MPVLFVGHGSPMNALGGNLYARNLQEISSKIPTPKNILVISAHWNSDDFQIYAPNKTSLIYDFYGFPEELYKLKYEAHGSLELSKRISDLLKDKKPILNTERGLDHGAWAVLLHLFPHSQIPVAQLSLNQNLTLKEHYEIGKMLAPLRDEGTLIVSSGNITHNLYQISWDKNPQPFDWAIKFDEHISKAIRNWDEESFLGLSDCPFEIWKKAHPTIEHYVPLLYALGASYKEKVHFFNEEIQNGSMSMKSLILGDY